MNSNATVRFVDQTLAGMAEMASKFEVKIAAGLAAVWGETPAPVFTETATEMSSVLG